MSMEEYHRLDILSAINKTLEEHGDYYENIYLDFAQFKRTRFHYSVHRRNLSIQVSDYFDIDGIPASFFTTAIENTLYRCNRQYDARTREFFSSRQFLDSQRPVYLQRHGARFYFGTLGGVPVWTANVYDDYIPSWFFSCILVNERIDSLEELSQFDLDPLFDKLGVPHEMRNVAICD